MQRTSCHILALVTAAPVGFGF